MDVQLDQHDMLKRLPQRERKRLQPYLETVSLVTKEELNERGSPLRYIHFPIDCAISLMDIQASGRTVEVTVIGREGCSSFSLLQGVRVAPCRVIVEVGGTALRLDVAAVESLLPEMPLLRTMITRFSALMFRETVISVGCSQFHTVVQRIGRWLLSHENRTGHRQFPFTHDFLAEQLGVQRVTVSEALAGLQDKGLIVYGYGKLELRNMKQLEQITCECFPVTKQAIKEFLADLDHYARTPGG